MLDAIVGRPILQPRDQRPTHLLGLLPQTCELELRRHAREQLARAERFHQVLVRACIEPLDARFPTRHNIWTPVWDHIQERVWLRGDGRRLCAPARLAAFALCFVRALAPAAGAGSLTPARRAFDRPMAIACFVERAPCFPSRT